MLLTLGTHAQRGLQYLACCQSVCRSVCLSICLSICLSVCLSVHACSGYEAANEWHQRFLNNENIDIHVAIFKANVEANVRSITHVPSPAGYSCHVRSRRIRHVVPTAGQGFFLECLSFVTFYLCSLCSQWIRS